MSEVWLSLVFGLRQTCLRVEIALVLQLGRQGLYTLAVKLNSLRFCLAISGFVFIVKYAVECPWDI